jgi:hypothetical protein
MFFPKAIQIHVKHWVLWWFYLGVICGIVALINIFFRDMSPEGIKLALIFGVLFWVLGGVAIYCLDAVKIMEPPHASTKLPEHRASEETEWHSASEFLLPGNSKSIFPPRY